MLKILTLLHTTPDVKSYRTICFENILRSLRNKTSVNITWLVYTPERLRLSDQHDPNITILDYHNFKNALEVVQKVKPDVIYVSPNHNLPDYALSLAGKFLKIPVVGELVNEIFTKSNVKELAASYAKQFFSNSVPTDTNDNEKRFMKRGLFFISKYLFLLRTQIAIGMNPMKIIQNFFMLIDSHFRVMKHQQTSRFAINLHFVENEKLVEKLVREGYDRASLVVTGNPMYDTLPQKIQKLRPSSRKDSKIRVLLLTHAMYEHGLSTKERRDSLVKGVVTTICKHKDEMSLEVKIHPSSEILSEYQSLIAPIDPSVPIHKQGDVVEFIASSDIVITYSTASSLINALVLNKPIIILNFFGIENDLLIEKDLALQCNDLSTLIPIIRNSLTSNPATNNKVDDFIREYFYKFDGNASERVSVAIMKLLEGKDMKKQV